MRMARVICCAQRFADRRFHVRTVDHRLAPPELRADAGDDKQGDYVDDQGAISPPWPAGSFDLGGNLTSGQAASRQKGADQSLRAFVFERGDGLIC
jgi:hypothetical protein